MAKDHIRVTGVFSPSIFPGLEIRCGGNRGECDASEICQEASSDAAAVVWELRFRPPVPKFIPSIFFSRNHEDVLPEKIYREVRCTYPVMGRLALNLGGRGYFWALPLSTPSSLLA